MPGSNFYQKNIGFDFKNFENPEGEDFQIPSHENFNV